MMNLTLLIPNLFWPDASQPEIYNDLPLPYLRILLSKSIATIGPLQETETWLCKEFNIARQHGNWPIAPLMLHADAPDLIKTSKDFWIRADPVHLRIEQNHIMLADSQAFQISQEEAEQIAQDLNNNLDNYDFSFLPLQPDRWYIQTPRMPKIHTCTLSQVTCQNINNFLPTGDESITWHKIFNEIQMLLHEHAVNQARESRGELMINSVWFWGGGNMPQSIQSPYTHIWSDNDFARALSLASNTSCSKLSTSATEWLSSHISSNHLSNHLVILDALHGKAKYRNAYGWRETLKNMEQNWFSPLYTALKEGKINQINIVTLNENTSCNFVIQRTDLWKFWLMTKPFSLIAMKTLIK